MLNRTSLNRRFNELVTGLTLAAVAWLGWLGFDGWQKDHFPVDQIFDASVLVPDYNAGGNPVVVYSRDIRQSFIGSFTVEIKKPDRATVCYGGLSGIKYDQNEAYDPTGKTLDWYVGAPCAEKLKVGSYFLETTYTIVLQGYPVKYLTTVSNIFNVTDGAEK